MIKNIPVLAKNGLLFSVFISILLIGCRSAKQLVESGNYDQAIETAIQKIRRDPKKYDKDKEALEIAFARAQKRDFEQINTLKNQLPSSWPEVYAVYDRIDHRQIKVMMDAPYFIRKQFRSITLDTVSIYREKEEAKTNAVQYLYDEANRKLNSGKPILAREAYADFLSAQKIKPDLTGLAEKIARAEEAGRIYLHAMVKNKTAFPLVRTVLQPFETANLPNGLSTWITPTIYFDSADFVLITEMRLADVSPERIAETRTTERREIQDGWNYQYDRKGNVMKDTAGNDIRIPRMITKTAIVTEHIQSREAVISGVIQLVNRQQNIEEKSLPFREQLVFEHRYVTFRGDREALRPETIKRLPVGPIPYPSPEKMMSDLLLRIRPRWNTFAREQQNVLLRD